MRHRMIGPCDCSNCRAERAADNPNTRKVFDALDRMFPKDDDKEDE